MLSRLILAVYLSFGVLSLFSSFLSIFLRSTLFLILLSLSPSFYAFSDIILSSFGVSCIIIPLSLFGLVVWDFYFSLVLVTYDIKSSFADFLAEGKPLLSPTSLLVFLNGNFLAVLVCISLFCIKKIGNSRSVYLLIVR